MSRGEAQERDALELTQEQYAEVRAAVQEYEAHIALMFSRFPKGEPMMQFHAEDKASHALRKVSLPLARAYLEQSAARLAAEARAEALEKEVERLKAQISFSDAVYAAEFRGMAAYLDGLPDIAPELPTTEERMAWGVGWSEAQADWEGRQAIKRLAALASGPDAGAGASAEGGTGNE